MSIQSTYQGDMFKFPEKIYILKKGVNVKKNFWEKILRKLVFFNMVKLYIYLG